MEQALEQPRLAHREPPGAQDAWELVLDQLRASMKRADYESRVVSLRPLGYGEGVFRVGAVNAYTRDWCKTRLGTQIARMLEVIYGRPVSMRFSLLHDEEAESAASSLDITRLPVLPARESGVGEGAGTDAPADGANAPTRGTSAPAKGVTSNGGSKNKKTAQPQPQAESEEAGSPRKIQLQRAYGTQRARVIQPERGMFVTLYFFTKWLPLLGQSALTTVMAARSLCYWNPMTGEMRNVIETDMSELARRASVSLRTVKDVLNNELVKQYFLRYKVRRVMTPNGVRTAGIILQVRMDDPLTPEDQAEHGLAESERWYSADFEDESED